MNVFINYRRADTQWPARQLCDELSNHLSKDQIFFDVDTIPIGVDFKNEITAWISQCDVFLALIGPNWLALSDAEPSVSRLQEPDDMVRMEIELAFGAGVPVVPVFIDGATLPPAETLPDPLRSLLWQNGSVLDLRTFKTDVRGLYDKMVGVASLNSRPDRLVEPKTLKWEGFGGEYKIDPTEELILNFLAAWPTWGFTPKRIINWGGQQPGFGELSNLSRRTLIKLLDGLVAQDFIRKRDSQKGNVLYQALKN